MNVTFVSTTTTLRNRSDRMVVHRLAGCAHDDDTPHTPDTPGTVLTGVVSACGRKAPRGRTVDRPVTCRLCLAKDRTADETTASETTSATTGTTR